MVPFPARLSGLSFRLQLQLVMLALLVLSVGSLFLLHVSSERALLARIRGYTDELSTAIEITQEQPGNVSDPGRAVEAYVEKLRALGVRDVSIADASAEVVQASTDPRAVGRRLERRRGPAEYVIRGVLREDSALEHPRTSSLTVPIVVGDRRVGYVVITRILDDFSFLSTRALAGRIAATLGVFALGMLLAFYLAAAVSHPVRALTAAAERVASGDLEWRVPVAGSRELTGLARAFNQMVEHLALGRAREEKLQLAERQNALGRLSSALAHEIRNPLNAISLTIDHVRAKLGPPDEPRRTEFDAVMATLKSEVGRLNRLVGDFLSFGRSARIDPCPCDGGEILGHVAALVGPKAREQGVVVDLDIAPALPPVVADAPLLKTCLLNLALNSFDAMPDGGRLRLGAAASTLDGSAAVAFVVSDSGVGMSGAAVASALEPYFSTKETGLGLGLSLVSRIVDGHGGRVSLDSRPGEGTTVTLLLPASVA